MPESKENNTFAAAFGFFFFGIVIALVAHALADGWRAFVVGVILWAWLVTAAVSSGRRHRLIETQDKLRVEEARWLR